MKYSFITLFLVVISFNLVAQNAVVTLTDNSEIQVRVEFETKAGFTTLSIVDLEGKNYTPERVKKIELEDGRIIESISVLYYKTVSEQETKQIFAESIIDNEYSLYEVFDSELKFAAGLKDDLTALQTINKDGSRNDLFKLVFSKVNNTQSCNLAFEIGNSKYSKLSFIYLTNKINSCLSPEYYSNNERKSLKTNFEFGFKTGLNISSIDFTANEGDPRDERILDFKESLSFHLGGEFNYALFGDWLFINTGFTFNNYSFTGIGTEDISYNRPLEFSEIILNGGFEIRKAIFGITFSLGGRNYHLETQDKEQREVIITYSFRRSDNLVFVLEDEIFKRDNKKTKYNSWNIMPSISKQLGKYLIIGIQFRSMIRSGEVVSEETNLHTDNFNYDYAFSALVRYRFFKSN